MTELSLQPAKHPVLPKIQHLQTVFIGMCFNNSHTTPCLTPAWLSLSQQLANTNLPRPTELQWIPWSRSGSDCLNGGAGFWNKLIGGDLLLIQSTILPLQSAPKCLKHSPLKYFKAFGSINLQLFSFSVLQCSDKSKRSEMMHESGSWQSWSESGTEAGRKEENTCTGAPGVLQPGEPGAQCTLHPGEPGRQVSSTPCCN